MPHYLRIPAAYQRPNIVARWAACLGLSGTSSEDQGAVIFVYDGAAALERDAKILDSLLQILALLPPGAARAQNVIEISNDDGATYVKFTAASATPVPLSNNNNNNNGLPDNQVTTACGSQIEQPPFADNPILSLGFELQSNDLLIVVLKFDNGLFTCRYPDPDDIPEGTQVPLFVDTLDTAIGVQLDATGDQTPEEHYLRKLDGAVGGGILKGNDLLMLLSEAPMDTEFVALNTKKKSLAHFEPERHPVDPVELMKSHFELLKVTILYFRLRDDYEACKYTTPYPSQAHPTKTNLLWTPKSIQADGRPYLGFMTQTLDEANVQVSCVAQVTFGCTLENAYPILTRLVAATADNPHKAPLLKVLRYVESLFGPSLQKFARSNVLSFTFLLSYYLHIMVASSKQDLGIALRHRFVDVFASLGSGEKDIVYGITNGYIEAMLAYATYLEKDDDIHRYDYQGPQVVLIEYRLFNYVASAAGMEVVDLGPLVPHAPSPIIFIPEDEDSDDDQ